MMNTASGCAFSFLLIMSCCSRRRRNRCICSFLKLLCEEQRPCGAGSYDVSIQRISGNLTVHYDPRSKVLRLSDSVYGNTSVAAIGVAAHECGHEIRHGKN